MGLSGWTLHLAVSALAVGRWGVADAASVDLTFEVKGSEMQGRRPYQEDRHAVHRQQDGGMHYFGVFDGHGGVCALCCDPGRFGPPSGPDVFVPCHFFKDMLSPFLHMAPLSPLHSAART